MSLVKARECLQKFGPDKTSKFPNSNIKEICFIKNVITRPNIVVGDLQYI